MKPPPETVRNETLITKYVRAMARAEWGETPYDRIGAYRAMRRLVRRMGVEIAAGLPRGGAA